MSDGQNGNGDNGDVKKGPIETLDYGAVKSKIWNNERDGRNYYKADISKTYRDKDGNFRETNSFSDGELLAVEQLAKESRKSIWKMRQADRNAGRVNAKPHGDRDR